MQLSMFDGKTVFITGGTGTWGQEFTRQILSGSNPKEIRIYSRGEYEQTNMRRKFQNHNKLRYIIGDVRDRERLQNTMRGVDYVIHLAALKHIPVVEENPIEALKTNTLGTQNIIDASIHNNVYKVLFVSSDKAVDPLNFYGVTKLAGEKLMVAANENPAGRTRFVCYRGGNVMGSRGSIIPVFREQILRDNVITVTDESMTRFYMSAGDIIERAFLAFCDGLGGEIFIPVMRAATLKTLADEMVGALGNRSTKIKKIGVRPGEKNAELLISKDEIVRTRKYKSLFVVLPFFPSKELQKKYGEAKKINLNEYSSSSVKQFSNKEMRSLLAHEGFLNKDVNNSGDPLFFKKDKWTFS